ncbi:hypothetical protein EXIGLDRAFT_841463 [Exidia glandulosa HHB12029]|uniref:Novel STAND NTPase 1 domain-containing protein n=1 Tax=Exidia glandulosa HHB12029 TaxID=1314781 RepID=A0A165DVV6_EXIGL|nr:hypothetical protein EXIGLDRAFT_841463 [Exidia glandulosa HHB12029]
MAPTLGTLLVAGIAETSGGAIADHLLRTGLSISTAADTLRVNQDTALALARRVEELVNIALSESNASEDSGSELGATQVDIGGPLEETHLLLEEIKSQSFLAQVLYKDRNARKLSDLSRKIDDVLRVLRLRISLQLDDAVSRHVQNAVTRASQPLPELISPSEGKMPSVPPNLPLFFGRESETCAVARIVTSDAPRAVAILGAPGIGKTSVATAVLHASSVIAHFAHRRYFVACDSVEGRGSTLFTICAAFNIAETSRRAAIASLVDALSTGPSLLVLDNFESAWEADDGRAEAEETLASLAEIPSLALIVTMRGIERPHGVAWTQPYLPPLSPLNEVAARQLFHSISNLPEDDIGIKSLLCHLDNVPLPLVLLANMSQYESSSALLAQWRAMKTSMLQRGDGSTKLTSLDVSIELSLVSPRLRQHPGAVTILALLSILPQGVIDADFYLFTPSDCARSLSCLLQTALAYRASDGRVRVLAPIREFMLSRHPPTDEQASSLFEYYFTLAALTTPETMDRLGEDSGPALAAMSQEVENISAVIRYALDHVEDPRSAVKAAFDLTGLFTDTGVGSISLLEHALSVSRSRTFDDLSAELLHLWGLLAFNSTAPGNPVELWKEAHSLCMKTGNARGAIHNTLRLAHLRSPADGLVACQSALTQAEDLGDAKLIANCYTTLGDLHERAGRVQEARSAFLRAIELFRSLGQSVQGQLTYSMYIVADLELNSGNLRSGIAGLEEALALMKGTGYWVVGLPDIYHLLGIVYQHTGNFSRAVEYLNLGITEARSSGNTGIEMACSQELLRVHLLLGDVSSAEHVAAVAAELLKASDDTSRPYKLIFFLRLQGELLLYRGALADARAALYGSVLATRSPETTMVPQERLAAEAYTLELLGQVELHDGNSEEACRNFTVAAIVFRGASRPYATVLMLTRLAVALDSSDSDASEKLLDALILPLQRYEMRLTLADALLQSAQVLLRRKETNVARQRIQSALALYEDMKMPRGVASSVALLQKCS